MPTEYKQNQLKSSVGHPIHPHFARWGHSVGKGLLSVVVRLAMTSESMGSHYNAKYAKVLTPKTTLINNPPCFAHTKPTKMRTIISVTVGNTSYTFWPPTATNNFFWFMWYGATRSTSAKLFWYDLMFVEGEYAWTVAVARQEAQLDYECRLQWRLKHAEAHLLQFDTFVILRIYEVSDVLTTRTMILSLLGPCLDTLDRGQPHDLPHFSHEFQNAEGNKWRNPCSWQSLSLSLSIHRHPQVQL